MKRFLIFVFIAFLSAWTSAAFAYEPGTHGKMSDQAAQHSVLVFTPAGTPTVLQDLGLTSYTDWTSPALVDTKTIAIVAQLRGAAMGRQQMAQGYNQSGTR